MVISITTRQFRRTLTFTLSYDPALVITQREFQNVLPSCMSECSLYTWCLSFIIYQSQCTTLKWILNKTNEVNTPSGRIYFQRADIQNIAKGKTTSQSSQDSHISSQYAVDGLLVDSMGFCHYPSQAYDDGYEPWWMIDLGLSYSIFNVKFIVGKTIQTDDCKTTQEGEAYKGTINTTTEGYKCQRWDSQSPHKHSYLYLGDQENYCRKTTDYDFFWCYTTLSSVRWSNCTIPYCVNKVHDVTVSVRNTVGNTECGFYKGPALPGQWAIINCLPFTTGRYVELQKAYQEHEVHLEICEVEVEVLPQ